MASGTRSSKRKSSPSPNKKRRIKDRSKKRSKLGGGKSKKVYRRESPDSYSDDESFSSDSKLQCSATDSDSGRRSRSRTRKDTSKRRKKSRVHRMRSESSEERKPRRSKKKSKDTDAKRKRLRRKRRRELSVSSSSRSVSCSTCESSDDSEKEHKRTEKRRGRSRRDLDEDRPRVDGVGDSYRIEDQGLVENNPRRLRSVIIFAKECEEADKELLDTDVHKEEIIYDRDEYPSPKSNDSNDGDNKREACHVRTGYLEDQHEKMVGSKFGVSEVSERSDLAVIERDVNASTDTGSNASDLEAVLRQKALENLRKFKGGLRGNAKKPVSIKSSNDGEVKQSSNPNTDVECQKKNQEASVGGVGALSIPCQTISTLGQHSSRTIQVSSSLNMPVAESLRTLPPTSKMVNPPNEGSADGVATFKGGEVGMLSLKEGHLGGNKLTKKVLPTQESPVFNILSTETLSLPLKEAKRLAGSVADVNEKHEIGASTLIQCQMAPIPESSVSMSVPAEIKDTTENVQTFHHTKIETAVDKTTTGGETSNAKDNKEDSQFQQKTMSVMRGGEMVQVSYKVYIPKNAPALARRKLKR